MAEQDSGQERTQEATEKRKEQARKEGQIPRSRELNTFAMVLASTLGLAGLGPMMLDDMRTLMTAAFTPDRAVIASPKLAFAHFASALGDALLTIAPLLALLTIVGLAAPMLLGGFNFSSKALAPKFDRINPLKGIKRIFSTHGLIELAKALLKFTLIASVIGLWLWATMDDFLALGRMPYPESLAAIGDLVLETLLMVLAPLAVIALMDAPMQVMQHVKKLKMTQQEIKEEYKEAEGSPEMKGQRRQMQMQMARQRTAQRVPEADVVVTNPTHFAVALKYDEANMHAPTVVAKGTDLMAAHIRTLATQAGVPIIPAPPLARALHYSTEIDETIPEGLFLAVAHVLSYVFQLRQARKNPWSRRRRVAKFDGENLPIPQDLRHDP
ncbi:MAG: flagellar biosynthesis protein FlhB [Chromatiales bacterium]|nr:flagellar biosynthesis protein FlhB [Gammaproteobacteria bacterium]MCP5352800.1 flagellar biosynthesis protein FlhB [Chromatiales bacterium]